MNNELLWIIVFIIDFSALLLIYKFFGRIGLFAWVAMATVIANIQVIKKSLLKRDLIDIDGENISFNDTLFKLWLKRQRYYN